MREEEEVVRNIVMDNNHGGGGGEGGSRWFPTVSARPQSSVDVERAQEKSQSLATMTELNQNHPPLFISTLIKRAILLLLLAGW